MFLLFHTLLWKFIHISCAVFSRAFISNNVDKYIAVWLHLWFSIREEIIWKQSDLVHIVPHWNDQQWTLILFKYNGIFFFKRLFFKMESIIKLPGEAIKCWKLEILLELLREIFDPIWDAPKCKDVSMLEIQHFGYHHEWNRNG